MIGNDIIDRFTAANESNWRRQGYLNKVYSEKEQELIRLSSEPDLVVWLMWSMKEAVYKIINRETGIRKLNPLAFEVTILYLEPESAKGNVQYDHLQFSTLSEITSEYIHTIAAEDQQTLELVTDLPDESNIVKKLNIPLLISGEHVSISHHGRYRRAVYLINPEFVL